MNALHSNEKQSWLLEPIGVGVNVISAFGVEHTELVSKADYTAKTWDAHKRSTTLQAREAAVTEAGGKLISNHRSHFVMSHPSSPKPVKVSTRKARVKLIPTVKAIIKKPRPDPLVMRAAKSLVFKSAFGVSHSELVSKELWHGTSDQFWKDIKKKGIKPSRDGSGGPGVYTGGYPYAETFAHRGDSPKYLARFYGEGSEEHTRITEARKKQKRGKMIAVDSSDPRAYHQRGEAASGVFWRDVKGIHAQNAKKTTMDRLYANHFPGVNGNVYSQPRNNHMRNTYYRSADEAAEYKNKARVVNTRHIEDEVSPLKIKGVPESIARSQAKREAIVQANREKNPRKSGAPGKKKAKITSPPYPNRANGIDIVAPDNISIGRNQAKAKRSAFKEAKANYEARLKFTEDSRSIARAEPAKVKVADPFVRDAIGRFSVSRRGKLGIAAGVGVVAAGGIGGIHHKRNKDKVSKSAFGVNHPELVNKSYLPGGKAVSLARMAPHELAAWKASPKAGVRRAVKSPSEIAEDKMINESLHATKTSIAGDKWNKHGKNVYSNLSPKHAKRLQKQGALPKKAKRPTYLEQTDGDGFAGVTGHTGSKRDPVYVLVSAPRFPVMSKKRTRQINRYLISHEMTHAKPLNRTVNRMKTVTGDPKRLMKEEARADYGAHKKGAKAKIGGAEISGYAERAAIQAATRSREPGKSALAWKVHDQSPKLYDPSTPLGQAYKNVDFNDYSVHRAKLGKPVKPAKKRILRQRDEMNEATRLH